MMGYGKEYVDRGIVKWAGMYLSEHTSELNDVQQALTNPTKQKRQMSNTEINRVLSEAQLKSLVVSIQKEERDIEGHYQHDLIGIIAGFDERGLFIGSEKVDFDEIRHVAIYDKVKWSDRQSFLGMGSRQ